MIGNNICILRVFADRVADWYDGEATEEDFGFLEKDYVDVFNDKEGITPEQQRL